MHIEDRLAASPPEGVTVFGGNGPRDIGPTRIRVVVGEKTPFVNGIGARRKRRYVGR